MVGPESCPQRDPWFVKSTTLARQQYDQLDIQLFEQTGQRIGYDGRVIVGATHEDFGF